MNCTAQELLLTVTEGQTADKEVVTSAKTKFCHCRKSILSRGSLKEATTYYIRQDD